MFVWPFEAGRLNLAKSYVKATSFLPYKNGSCFVRIIITLIPLSISLFIVPHSSLLIVNPFISQIVKPLPFEFRRSQLPRLPVSISNSDTSPMRDSQLSGFEPLSHASLPSPNLQPLLLHLGPLVFYNFFLILLLLNGLDS